MARESRILEEIIEYTLKTLRKAGFIVDTIVYPEDERSIDIVGSSSDTRIIIKASANSGRVRRVEVDDLKKASVAYNTTPLIISRKHGHENIEEDVVYERHGVYVINDQTLENTLLRREKPLVQSVRGTLLVRINPEKFRTRRLELGYSLGDLASLIGVSRKAIYEYERGRIAVRIDTAIRIAEVLGEDVLEPVDIVNVRPEKFRSELDEEEPRNNLERLLFLLARSRGFELYRLLRTPVDYVLGEEDQSVSIVYCSERGRNFEFKIEQAEKISRTMRTKPVIIEEPGDVEIISESLMLGDGKRGQ